ncbi:MAG: ribonuclease III [Porticoccaceae bacterium]
MGSDKVNPESALQNLNYVFKDAELFDLALTHRSCGSPNNERMEFLGDALLGMIVSAILFQKFDKVTEGELSRLRSELVSGDSLAELAVELGLPKLLKLGSGEHKGDGRSRKSILAGTVEAIIGAIYLDGGIDACRAAVTTWFAGRVQQAALKEIPKDSKSRLQEYLQARGEPLPIYTVLSTSGAAHQQQFKIECKVTLLPEKVTAVASNRREAEKKAAVQALTLLEA